MRPFMDLGVHAAPLAQVPRPDEPDSAEISVETPHNAVGDDLEFGLKRGRPQQRLLKQTDVLLPVERFFAFLLGPLALGDVPEDADQARQPAEFHERGVHVGREDGAVLAQHGEVVRQGNLARGLSPDLLPDERETLLRVDVIYAEVQHLVAAVAKHPTDRLVGVGELHGPSVRDENAVPDSVEYHLQGLLGLH